MEEEKAPTCGNITVLRAHFAQTFRHKHLSPCASLPSHQRIHFYPDRRDQMQKGLKKFSRECNSSLNKISSQSPILLSFTYKSIAQILENQYSQMRHRQTY